MTALLTKPETPTIPVVAPRRRLRVKAILEFVIVLVIGLLLLEPLLTLGGVGNEESLDIDLATGWSPMPNRAYTYRKEGFAHNTINSLGMRDRERTVAKPPGTYRIAVVGDSLTEAEQVAFDKTYCSVLEKMLNAEGGGRKFEVLNFGVSAYSLGQEYLRLKDFALRFQPDLTIVATRSGAILYMGPNPRLGFFNARPIFGIAPDGTLVEDHHFQNYWLTTTEGKRMKATRWLRYNSRLWGVVSKCAEQIAIFKATSEQQIKNLLSGAKNVQGVNSSAPVTPSKGSLDSALVYLGQVADRLLGECKSECNKKGSEFVLICLPLRKEVREPEELKLLAGSASKHSFNFYDLNQTYDQADAVAQKSFFITDHMSESGHKHVAEQLYKILKETGRLN